MPGRHGEGKRGAGRLWQRIGILPCLALAPVGAGAQTLPVRPILECVVENGPGDFTAHFGYLNENPDPVAIPISSADNKFTPAPIDRGQPDVFEPGRTPFFPNAAFQADFDGSNLVWTLRSPNGSTRTSTASAGSSRCPEISPPDAYSMCYSVRPDPSAPRPLRPAAQPIEDRLQGEKLFDLRGSRGLCVPAAIGVEGQLFPVVDPDTYLLGSRPRLTRLEPPQERFDPDSPALQDLSVEDAFGTHALRVLRHDRFLASSAVCNPRTESCPSDPADVPIDGIGDDTFQCYAARLQPGSPKLPKGLKVSGSDAFEEKVYRLKRHHMLCTRASHDGSHPGVASDPDVLVCYRARPARLYCEGGAPPPFALAHCQTDRQCGGGNCIAAQPVHKANRDLKANNALSPMELWSIRVETLCVPGQIVAP